MAGGAILHRHSNDAASRSVSGGHQPQNVAPPCGEIRVAHKLPRRLRPRRESPIRPSHTRDMVARFRASGPASSRTSLLSRQIRILAGRHGRQRGRAPGTLLAANSVELPPSACVYPNRLLPNSLSLSIPPLDSPVKPHTNTPPAPLTAPCKVCVVIVQNFS